jgi:hypothetical protein
MTFETPRISCPRCGNFCERLVPGYKVCEPCLQLILPPGMRGETNLSSVASGVGHVLRTAGLQSAVILGLVNIPIGFITVLRTHEETQGIGALGALLWSPFPFFAGLVVLFLSHQSLRGMPISLRDAVGRVTSRFFSVFWTNLVSAFFAALWSLLFILPGIHKSICYCLAANIALFENQSGDDAIAASMQRTSPLLGILYALGIAAAVSSAMLQAAAAVFATGLTGAAEVAPELTIIAALLSAAAAGLASAFMSLLTLTTQQVIYEQSALHAADLGLLVVGDDL